MCLVCQIVGAELWRTVVMEDVKEKHESKTVADNMAVNILQQSVMSKLKEREYAHVRIR